MHIIFRAFSSKSTTLPPNNTEATRKKRKNSLSAVFSLYLVGGAVDEQNVICPCFFDKFGNVYTHVSRERLRAALMAMVCSQKRFIICGKRKAVMPYSENGFALA